MRLTLYAVGNKMPAWVTQGFNERFLDGIQYRKGHDQGTSLARWSLSIRFQDADIYVCHY